VLHILKSAFKGFGKDECGTRAAALAYSTIFALPPLLILVVTIAGRVWGPEQVQQAIEGQFSGMVGSDAAKQIHDMVAHGRASKGGGLLGTILGIVGLIIGATGAFVALQDALNHAWEVKPDPKHGGIKNFIMKRVLSFGMVLGLGFLVAVSLALSAGISAFTSSFGGGAVAYVIDIVLSLVILSALFGALFKFLPDAKLEWKDVLVGGLATAVLFVIGKFAIGLYLGHSKPGDSFGAASAFAVLLVWIYYSGMIVLFGAEFTQEWARAHGHEIVPRAGAVRVIEQEKEIRGGVVDGGRTTAGAGSTPGNPQPVKGGGRGGAKDWILGLPVLYWLIRNRDSQGAGR
jgi:membrane protein